MDIQDYYDYALENTMWWLDEGTLLSNDTTEAAAFYVYDMIILGCKAKLAPENEAVPIILGQEHPMMVWLTDREILVIDPRPDKQDFKEMQGTVSYAVISIAAYFKVPWALILERASGYTHRISLGVGKEEYSISVHQLLLSPSMTASLSAWKKIASDNLNRPSPSEPLEPV